MKNRPFQIIHGFYANLRFFFKTTFKSRIIFISSKGLSGVGFSHTEWIEIKDLKEGTVTRIIIDKALLCDPRGKTITYNAPSTDVIEKMIIKLFGRGYRHEQHF